MKMARGKWTLVLLAAVLALTQLTGCERLFSRENEDIVILFTNDVHGVSSEGIGYAGLAAYKEWLEEETPYVTLVDCGDALQGDALGAVSRGAYLVEIMNAVGYDFAVLGNHEFDYGMEQLASLLSEADAQYLGCNIRYTGEGESAVLAALAPYALVSYGAVDVAYVGVSTPESIAKSTPAYFMGEDGDFVYDFCGASGETLYAQVQRTVDECRQAGADYVIVLAHLGVDEASAPFCSTDLIAATSGIDAVLDGHSHSVIPCDVVRNEAGENVLLASTGTGLANIGQLIITPSGHLQTSLISAYPEDDAEVQAYIDGTLSQYEADLNRVVARSEVLLTTLAEDGQTRQIRNRETNLGDFCADAYRAMAGADIAIVNGGGIRADIAAGEVTYGDIIAVHPYGNTLCMVEATGQEILDALEMASRDTQAESGAGGTAIGENGGFLQVSGLMYTIDTAIPSSVVVDENGMFVSCGDSRRVKDVLVLGADGGYEALDPAAVYTVASHNYLFKDGGDGLNLFMDNDYIIDEGMLDYQILIAYVDEALGGVIGEEYAQPQGRILVE